ncbi:hypothetical protein [Sporichthya sp.]|uniref:hypothetical protein n=1 Tax=Sporichthya sp. TaxID=65475 RepID=UPI0025FB4608|nr:hypothetical protein [Sporichthya sp.]
MRAEQLGRAVLGVAAGALMLATLGVAADATGAAGYQPMTALINGSPVSDEVGILKNGSPNSLKRWAPVVMGAITPATTVRGNRFLSGMDPSWHYDPSNDTGGNAHPTDPANPSTSGAEHLVEAGVRFAGAIPGAPGVYLSPGCAGEDLEPIASALTAGGGFDIQSDGAAAVACSRPPVRASRD